MATMTIGIGFNFEERRPLQGRLADHDALSHNEYGETMALPASAPERSGERLSLVQKQVLLMAYMNRLEAERTAESPGPDLYYQQALEEVYGFTPAVGGEYTPGGKRFDRQAIGAARYNAGQAALSRTVRRLQDHGLILCVCKSHNRSSGCSITPKGQRLIHEWVKARSG